MNPLKIGVATRDITSPLSVPYLAGLPRHKPFTGVANPMRLRALALARNDCTLAIISTEAIGFSDDVYGGNVRFHELLRETVAKKTGVRDVMFTAAHIHSTPDTLNFRPLTDVKEAKPWLDRVIESAASAVAEAKDDMFEASMFHGCRCVPGYTMNRRGSKIVSDELNVIYFKAIDGDRSAALLHFACHPVVMQVTDAICTDYVGVLTDAVERKTGGVALFVQGACGDIDPALFRKKNSEDYTRMGNALADAALSLIDDFTAGSGDADIIRDDFDANSSNAVISAKYDHVSLPSRILPSEAETKKMRIEYNRLHDTKRTKEDDERYSDIEEMLCRIAEGDESYDAYLQAFKIGGLILVGIPGEVFCRMGYEIGDLSRESKILTVGYANGYLGYIIPPSEWDRGGYEAELGMWSKLSPDAYDILMRAIKRMLSRID